MMDESATTRIKKLSPLLINQLAAGEVVTRPAAVVKELLENAIDAEATEIDIHITQGGMGMIQVSDNGTGIYSEDMVMAITRHATSKIADVGTLQGIRTLGFRGEALAAIAAVSRLQLISSHNDEGIGRQLQVAGVLADTPTLTPVVHSRGTTVTIKDLYFNVPARRGNLKSVATEFAHIEAMVREVALARSDIRIHLTHDHKKRLLLDAHHDNETVKTHPPLSRLEQALGRSLTVQAQPLHVDLSSLLSAADTDAVGQLGCAQACIDGWLFIGNDSNDNMPKLIYINGRLVKEPIISNHLRQLTAPATGYALYFQLPMHWLNLNVHPSKQRIKIGSISNILAHLGHAIRSTVPTKPQQTEEEESNNVVIESASRTNPPQTAYTNTPRLKSWTNDVEAPKTAYQVNTPANQSTTPQQRPAAQSATAPALSVPAVPTIRCLAVIDELPEALIPDAVNAPWLLLLSQDTCCLMALSEWQSIIDASMPDGAMNTRTFDKSSAKAQTIEQQIQAAINQLPANAQYEQYMTLWQDIEAHSSATLSVCELAVLMLQKNIPALDMTESCG